MSKTETTQERFLYEEIAEKIVHLIETETLAVGDRLPSVRRLSAEQGVSVSVVLQAYRLLEDRGYIQARPQSGFYVCQRFRAHAVPSQKSQPPLAACSVGVGALITDVIETISEPDVVPLGAALPAPELLPGRQLNRALARTARAGRHRGMTYLLPQGSLELRQEIARRSLYWGGSLTSDDLVVTSGCMEALTICLQAVARPGDTIAVESPTYFGILQLIDVLGMRALEVPTYPDYGLCVSDLREVLATKRVKACLFMPSFHNPLGSLLPDDKKQALVALLKEFDLPLIEDDLYGELYFGKTRPRPVKAFDDEGRVLYCSSFTKTLAPGYRVGFTAPGRYREEVKRIKLASTISTSAPVQLALAEYLAQGGYDHHLRRLRRILTANVDRMTNAILAGFPEGTRVTRPQGGFVLWVELPPAVDALQLYRAARAEQISITPGPIFSASGGFEHFIRLNCGHPWSTRIEDGIERLGRLVHAQMG